MKAKLTGPIILITGIIALLVFRYNVRNQNERENSDFDKKGVFTLGKVIDYSARTYGTNGGSSAFLKFSFKVQGVKYTAESDYNVPDDDGPKSGSLFMAVYLPNTPKKCALLLNFPVRDSSDYKRYIEEFKVNRPKLRN